MNSPTGSERATDGLTLLELVLAVGLLSFLVVGVLQLFDTSLTLLDRTESRRDLVEMGASVVELLAEDLSAAHGGERGDLLCDWAAFDTDGDGIASGKWPRVRVVRAASAAELERLGVDRGPALAGGTEALIEVCWAVLPPAAVAGSDPRLPVGVLWRGERSVEDSASLSFFDPEFFDARGRPRAGALNEVTGGVLWLRVLCASPTTLLRGGWELGEGLEHASASWDAWARGRPDEGAHRWNARPAGLGEAIDEPLLPRRVRIELEVERPRDRKRRPHLTDALDVEGGTLRVSDPTRLPDVGTFLRVDEEWMELRAVNGDLASVGRGARGTRSQRHEARSVVHFGARVVRDVPVVLYREDWDL